MDINTTKKLNNGVEIPCLGLGVFRSAEGDETVNAIRWAVEAGYRHIDTAKAYKNENSVGDAIKTCGVPREKLFITTKLWNQDQRDNNQMAGFEGSLRELGTEYVDLYLVHWPVPERYVESWKLLEKILESGKARAIGVSNFQTHHLEELFSKTGVVPAVNQVEIHPHMTQEPLVSYCESKGIAMEAYSPLGGIRGRLYENASIKAIAEKHGKTPAQVILRWDLQRGIVTIPKSVRKERIVENCSLYDFELSEEDMKAVSGLNQNTRYGSDPDNFSF